VRYSTKIISEPAGEVYLQLLAFAQQESAYFSLTWQQQVTADGGARIVATELRPFLHQQRTTSEWPGTKLLRGVATVRWYRFTPQARQVLQFAGRLYAWRWPDRPEDLAFYYADERCWLASIAHEREAFIDLDETGLQALRREVPGMQLSRDA
jgi:hypothetical protein